MAVLGNKKSKVSDEIPSSSMADIAFLLLIFFLVTTTFPKDKGLQIVLPEQAEEIEVSQKNVLHVIVNPNGTVTIKRGESQQEQLVRPERCGEHLAPRRGPEPDPDRRRQDASRRTVPLHGRCAGRPSGCGLHANFP